MSGTGGTNRWVRRVRGAALGAGLALQACMSTAPTAPPAFFLAAPQDVATVQALAQEQERRLQSCVAARSCDRAHYMRALAALYEDRALAVQHFRAVAAEAPKGRYADASRQWIRLLEQGPNVPQHQAARSQAVERLVRDVLEHETAAASRSVETKPEDVQSAQSLKRQLKAREKKIDELTKQIDALKRVDREVKERVKPSRPVN